MGYDYSRGFVHKHRDLLNQLIDLARNGEIGELTFERGEDLNKVRQIINNLLAVASMYYPDFAGLRRDIRTWTEYKGELWHLYVGRPAGDQVLFGHKPKILPVMQVRSSQQQAQPQSSNGEVRFPEVVSKANMFRFFDFFAKSEADPAVKVIRYESDHVVDQERLAAICDQFAPQWLAELASPTTVLLRRNT